jgi:hypothetical protein
MYLTDVPRVVEEYGLCKTLAVRREVIHIKHIFTEVFVRKTIDIEPYLKVLGWTLFDYMEYMTNRLRRVHYFSRDYRHDVNEVIKSDRDKFFPTIELYNGLNNVIALDFDGVITKNAFNELYELCVERCKTVVCTANPTVRESWFEVRNYSLPSRIYACKGKVQKIRQLIELNKKYDYVFYVDNEVEYLEYAWLMGIQTYLYQNKQIKYFSLKTK